MYNAPSWLRHPRRTQPGEDALLLLRRAGNPTRGQPEVNSKSRRRRQRHGGRRRRYPEQQLLRTWLTGSFRTLSAAGGQLLLMCVHTSVRAVLLNALTMSVSCRFDDSAAPFARTFRPRTTSSASPRRCVAPAVGKPPCTRTHAALPATRLWCAPYIVTCECPSAPRPSARLSMPGGSRVARRYSAGGVPCRAGGVPHRAGCVLHAVGAVRAARPS